MKKTLISSIVIAASLATATAHAGAFGAEEDYTPASDSASSDSALAGWYAGLGFNHDGQSYSGTGSDLSDSSGGHFKYGWSDQDYGFDLFAGKWLSDSQSVEFNLAKVGNGDTTASSGGTSVESKFSNYYYMSVQSLHHQQAFGPVSLFIGGGLGLTHAKYEGTSSATGTLYNTTETQFSPVLSAGADISKCQYGARIRYSQFMMRGQHATDPTDTGYTPHLFNVDAYYRF